MTKARQLQSLFILPFLTDFFSSFEDIFYLTYEWFDGAIACDFSCFLKLR